MISKNNAIIGKQRITPTILALLLLFSITGCTTYPQRTTLYDRPQVYFSPEGKIKSHIISAINNSRVSIDVAMFDFTSQDIKVALEKARNRGIVIRLIADSRQYKGPHSVVQSLIDSGFNIKIVKGEGRGIMHNKFAIFDKVLLFTGSYNWTDSAERYNYENAIFLSNQNTVKQYQEEFERLWRLNE
ncbi:MAG: phospholipase D-like domain-containing protein [Candidatus Omnitrophota bacterium]